jgi:hypothetical protein
MFTAKLDNELRRAYPNVEDLLDITTLAKELP